MEPFIDHLPLNRINSDTFARYRSARRNLSVRTRNQKIALAGRILQLAATVWCFPGTNLTWLTRTPEILLEKGHRARQPYPLDEREQQLLLSELPAHAAEMAAFAINTGVRDRELCQLKPQRLVLGGITFRALYSGNCHMEFSHYPGGRESTCFL